MASAEVTVNDFVEGAATANVDTVSLIGVGGKTVHRQIASIGSPVTFGRIVEVNANSELLVKHTDSITISNSFATEATLAIISGNLSDIETLITTLNSTVATQATISSILLAVDGIEASLTSLNGKDYATQTTLAAILAAVDGIEALLAGTLTVSGTVTANVSDNATRDNGKIDIAAFDVALPAGTNNIGDVDVITLPNVAQATSSNLKNEPNGHVAHDGIDSGNPIKIGGRARTANITSVAQDDRVDSVFDKNGRQIIVAGAQRELRDSMVNASAITNTTETTIIAAVASEFHDIESIIISNSSAVATLVQIRDTTAGTVLINIYSPAGSTVGVSIPNGLPQTTVNTNWTAQAVTTASSLFVTMTFIKNV